MTRATLIILSLLLVFSLHAQQDMSEGFGYLNEGHWDKAEVFFTNVVANEGQNLTAQICLGRAIGLNGNPVKAYGLFDELSRKHPDNLEVLTNKAESLLWQNECKKAVPLYQELLKKTEYADPIYLGLANAFNCAGMHEQAYETIQKIGAIDVGSPADKSLQSIMEAYAHQSGVRGSYKEAHQILDDYNQRYPSAISGEKIRGVVYLKQGKVKKAKNVYLALMTRVPDDRSVKITLSYIYGLLQKTSNALSLAHKVKAEDRLNQNWTGYAESGINLANTLIAQGKLKHAGSVLTELVEMDAKNLNARLLRLKVWNWLKLDKQVNDELTFVLGEYQNNEQVMNAMAEIHLTNKAYKKASIWIGKSKTLNPNGLEVYMLERRLNDAIRSSVAANAKYTVDNQNNHSFEYGLNAAFQLSNHVRPFFAFNNKFNGVVDETFDPNNLMHLVGGLQLNLSNKFSAEIGSGISKRGREELILLRTKLKYQPRRLTHFSLQTQNERLTYNIIESESGVSRIQFGAEMFIANENGWGGFGTFRVGSYSDDNVNFDGYTAVFKQLNPKIKSGIAFSGISFKNNEGAIYFSPGSYRAAELFTRFDNQSTFAILNWYVACELGLGRQKVEDQQWNSAYRINVEMGKSISRFKFLIKGEFSNAAFTTGRGYSSKSVVAQIAYTF